MLPGEERADFLRERGPCEAVSGRASLDASSRHDEVLASTQQDTPAAHSPPRLPPIHAEAAPSRSGLQAAQHASDEDARLRSLARQDSWLLSRNPVRKNAARLAAARVMCDRTVGAKAAVADAVRSAALASGALGPCESFTRGEMAVNTV